MSAHLTFFLALLSLQLLVLTVKATVTREDDYRTYGTVLMDSLTFPKIVPNARNHVIVMCVNKGQVGKLTTDGVRDEFLAIGETLEPMVASNSILFAQVIVNGAQNKKLSSKVGARENFIYPSFHLFKAGSSESVPFLSAGEVASSAPSMNDISRWIYKETGIHIGAAGTVSELDRLVEEFLAADASNKASIIAKTRAAADTLTKSADRESSLHYVKTMEKLMNTPSYAKDEVVRLVAIVDSDKVSSDRKQEFSRRINIVKRFIQ